MGSHARPASRLPFPVRRVALRAGLLASAAGAALGSAGAAAHAAEPAPGALDTSGLTAPLTSPGASVEGTQKGLAAALAPVQDLQLNPLANTGVDPLDNAVGTSVADFKPVSTEAATGPLARGASLRELPLVGPVADGVLPG